MMESEDIVVKLDDLESRGGHGLQCASITVTRPDGQIQRFYVRLYCLNSKVSCSVSAVRPNLAQDVVKRVLGSWFKRINR